MPACTVGWQTKNVSSFYPNFHVLGMPKCGTSYLYRLIESHPLVQSAAKQKEYCFTASSAEKILPKVASLYSINGCIAGAGQLAQHQCLWPLLTFQPKYLIAVRDPAEYLWARYNYWTIDIDVDLNPPTHWATHKTYRSPELFHELVVAGDRVVIDTRIDMVHYAMPIVANWRIQTQNALDMVGEANLLVVDTTMSDPGITARLAAFLGLTNAFKLSPSTTINAGASFKDKGDARTASNKSIASRNGLYEVSAWRPMLDATRILITQREHHDCVKLAKRFSVLLRCSMRG